MVLGWSEAHRGEHDSALAHVNDGLATLKSTQNNYHLTHRLVLRADTLALCGRTAEAIDAIDEAQEAGNRTGERWYESEVLRKKAALLASKSSSGNQNAESLLEEAMAAADRCGAGLWRLRAAADLARLYAKRGALSEARDLIMPYHDRLAEGLDTRELTEARALLDGLGG
jgi:predicted ATPase